MERVRLVKYIDSYIGRVASVHCRTWLVEDLNSDVPMRYYIDFEINGDDFGDLSAGDIVEFSKAMPYTPCYIAVK